MNGRDFRVAVIGAGVFGAWAAYHLHAAGARVSLVDAYGPANPRASSGDHSRILRCGYGPDDIYAQMAWRSLQQWRELQLRLGPEQEAIWHRCGVLWLAPDGDAYTVATRTTLERAGLPVEALTPDDLLSRFPQLDARDLGGALFEPECGVLMAERAVGLMVQQLEHVGVQYIRGRVNPPMAGVVRAIRFDDGRALEADRYVFACGAWLPRVFPSLLEGRIRPTRQTVVYFGTSPDTGLFGPARTPAWVDFHAGIYGVPDIDNCGLKVGIDEHGPPIDPDSDDRVANALALSRARLWLAQRFPAMANAPVVEARVCQYENTSNGDFLIDRHPEHDNIWIVGGGSGHGFKHGPAVGEDAAQLVLTGAPVHSRFSLTSKATEANRTVY
jgi:glycine/D-amino acid oxidase-like deaminating enzyme